MDCNICHRSDCSETVMKRQIGPSTYKKTCEMKAMMERALDNQVVATEPPDSPGSKWNLYRWYYD